ncbi:MAG: DNA/RNA helicase domain-containing protein [Candidatus Woesearchaeota archaeon]
MIIYENTKEGFLEDSFDEKIVDRIRKGHEKNGLSVGNKSEIRSWKNSLNYMHKVLSKSNIPNNSGIAIEFKIPLTSRRIDFMISGYDENHKGNVIIIELKQWDGKTTKRSEKKDGIVETFVGGGIRETTHPSYQAWSYYSFIKDFNLNVQNNQINLQPCAYLHNFEKRYSDELDNKLYAHYVKLAPLYLKGDAKKLKEFIDSQIKKGDNKENLYKINNGKIKPSKSLQERILSMIQGNKEFTLIDSQKIIYEKALHFARKSNEDGKKRVFIVEGGPGTGKSVLAVNLLSQLIQEDMVAQYVSKNRAPREVYKQKLKKGKKVKEINHLFKGAGTYVSTPKNTIPALIVDEAHRLNEKSNFFGKGENQIMEIINASKFSVFFIDESQRIHIDDIGSKHEIQKFAKKFNAEIHFDNLESQFRCNGSKGYISWLDDVLQIKRTANADGFDIDYDIKLFNDPNKLHEEIRKKNEDLKMDSRVVAGYCWEWDKDGRKNQDKFDIKIGDFQKSWNLRGGNPWAIDKGSMDEVGCIHTCQGLEFGYVGVIIGKDMRYDDGKIITDYKERASTDRSLFGIKKMFKEDPKLAKELSDELIKNTYRTLMSRGMKGCYIYCCDEGLKKYLEKRIKNISKSN